MKNLLSFVVFFYVSFQIHAQKVDEILENGIPLNKNEAIFLKYDAKKNIFRYAVAYSRQDITKPIKPISLNDSIIFLSRQSEVPIYILPFNPLTFSTSTELVFIEDKINKEAEKAYKEITQQLQNLKGLKNTPFVVATDGKEKAAKGLESVIRATKALDCEKNLDSIIDIMDKLNNNINEYKKKNFISQNFERLKSLTFEDEALTKSEIAEINAAINSVQTSFKEMETEIEKITKKIEDLVCEPLVSEFVYKSHAKNLVKEIKQLKENETEKLKNLIKAYDVVKKHQLEASKGGGEEGLRWLYPKDFIALSDDKISIYNLTMKKGGYVLKDNQEIIVGAFKDTLKRTIRVRRFQKFIPEVSVGTAFTFFKYHTYGTVTDSTGQNFVGSPVEKELRNLNITTMVNFNYYLQNSPIHPFYQLGFGVNEGIPTLLTGVGFRSIFGINKISVSGGIAATWLEELNNLKVGDPVSGTAAIEEDLKYQFSWPPKPYIGLQYNF